ncbi:methylthioribose-1-phosphate isomerase [candidate division MSBL1 archaeon SCGC-AAA385D11]|uniref:Putative methylthioribose-1-phosphate isomerase n=1 Tax=candidate division MSBL1 archaeon SCGC-AAA385D11 TaxID=1698286 RepID=A0A133VNH1_9EURY|nr:methylthioribose-1-phosphate isomerase [candidate division MSBL1 archaeon SCGC-AAA385D11]
MRTIQLKNDYIELIDQTVLPKRLEFVRCQNAEEVAQAIEQMKIRGAPALGAAAGMALAVTALHSRASDSRVMLRELKAATNRIKRTRPTAANLFMALNRVMKVAEKSVTGSVKELQKAVVEEAKAIAEEDVKINREMGRQGAQLIQEGNTILTHCNAGALACVDYGTALGVIRAARGQGKGVSVIATETRPLFQGSRLTTWELKHDGIPVTLITDGAVGHTMSEGNVDLVIVGADRIAGNGDVANKIGTYSIAVLANRYDIPFYVAAPTSTIDPQTRSGKEIEIEYRDPSEVTSLGGHKLAPDGIDVSNPAFDVTPAGLITKIITENGVSEPSELESLFT